MARKKKTTMCTDLVNNFEEQLRHAINNAQEEIDVQFATDIREMMEYAAQEFYEDYTPRTYKRKGSMDEFYNVVVTDTASWVELGEEFSDTKHSVNNEYIFETMFIEGWHGGADDGDFHPDPGTPWYRKYNSTFNMWHWLRKAERMPDGVSPYSIFCEQYDTYASSGYKEMSLKIFYKHLKPFL